MKGFIFLFLLCCCSFMNAQEQLSENLKDLKSSLIKVNASMIEADFKKNRYNGIHPRLLYTQKTVERITNLLKNKDPFVTKYYEYAKKSADEIMKEPLLHYGLDAAELRIPTIHQFAVQAPWLIFMYQMSGDKKYAERCYSQFEILSKYPDWGADRHFLDTGIAAFTFAFIYDGLYYYLSDNQRETLENAVEKYALDPGKYQIENCKGTWKWYVSDNNWNGICNGGLIMASLALFEKNTKKASQLITDAVNCLPNYLLKFEPDGQSEEGLMYWSYGIMYTIIALESMNNTLGTTYGLTNLSGLKKSGWFPFLMSGPAVSLNIGDDPLRYSRDISFFWFSKFYNDSLLAKQQFDLCMQNNRFNWQDIYFYNPSLIAQSENNIMYLDNHLHGIELYSIRENWKSDKAMYIAMHGGANSSNHGHLDAGSFYIQALGEVFADGNLGRDDYTFPGYFSKKTLPDYWDMVTPQQESGRWHFYRLRTEGKNCVIINPTIRPEQKETGIAKMKLKSSKINEESIYTIDLSDCYERDVNVYERSISMNRLKKSMSVKDVIRCKENNSDIFWLMHTRADVKLKEKGHVAVLIINGKQLKAVIQKPFNAKFKVLDATYLLPGKYPFTKNSINEGFKKLVIELNGIKETEIKVDFFVE